MSVVSAQIVRRELKPRWCYKYFNGFKSSFSHINRTASNLSLSNPENHKFSYSTKPPSVKFVCRTTSPHMTFHSCTFANTESKILRHVPFRSVNARQIITSYFSTSHRLKRDENVCVPSNCMFFTNLREDGNVKSRTRSGKVRNHLLLDNKNTLLRTTRFLSNTTNVKCNLKNENIESSAKLKHGQNEDEKSPKLHEKENIYTIPNLLCMTRIALTPVISYCVLSGSFEISLLLFTVAGVTDFLDGYIARNFKNQRSMMGSFLDPVADKFLIVTLFLSLTAANLIPVPLTGLIVARDVGLFGAGLVVRYQSLPSPKTVKKYFDVSYATAEISPTTISKLNTGVQLLLVAVTLGTPVFGYLDNPYLPYLWYGTAGSTILSGLSYMFSKNSYKILKSKDKNASN